MRPMSMIRLFASVALAAGSLLGQDRFEATRLTSDPAQEGFPSWCPDGRSLLYSYVSRTDSLGGNGIWRISIDDAQPVQVYQGMAEHPRLSPDGRLIVFDSDTGKSMSMVGSEGGSPREFLPDSIGIQNGGLPCWSPDGSQIAFTEGLTGALCIYDVSTGAVARVFREEGLLPLPGCWSGDGAYVLVALMDRKTRASTMVKISRDGRERQQITGHREGFYRYLALSPDGSLLVYAAMEGKDLGLWVMPAGGGPSLPLAVTHPGHNDGPAWSSDGRRMAFSSTRAGSHDIWFMDIDIEQLKAELRGLSQ